MELAYQELQHQYDVIYSYFKTTTELCDDLDWDGETLSVCFKDEVIEVYTYADLKEMIDGFGYITN